MIRFGEWGASINRRCLMARRRDTLQSIFRLILLAHGSKGALPPADADMAGLGEDGEKRGGNFVAGLLEAKTGRDRPPERLRGDDGRAALLFAGADFQCLVRGRRAVSAEHVGVGACRPASHQRIPFRREIKRNPRQTESWAGSKNCACTLIDCYSMCTDCRPQTIGLAASGIGPSAASPSCGPRGYTVNIRRRTPISGRCRRRRRHRRGCRRRCRGWPESSSSSGGDCRK